MRCSSCSKTVKPVVALDIDGTLGDYHSHLLEFMDGYFGRTMNRGWDGTGDWEDYLKLTSQEYREAKLAFRQGGMKRTMPMFPDARVLTLSAMSLGAEIWITTTRPWMRLDSVDPDTREWLDRKALYYDHLLYDDNKYHKLAELVDPERVVFVMDDLPEQIAVAAYRFGGAAYLIERDHNAGTRLATGSLKKSNYLQNLHQAHNTMTERIRAWA